MPSSTRRKRYRSESPPPPPSSKQQKKTKEEVELEDLIKSHQSRKNWFVDIISSGDPPSILHRIVSYLDVCSLGRFKIFHPRIMSLITQSLMTQSFLRWNYIPTDTATAEILSNDPIVRMQLWIKITDYAERMERWNNDHYYVDDTETCICNKSRKRQEQCKLPNLFVEPYTNYNNNFTQLKRMYHFFARISYRIKETNRHRLVWEGFLDLRDDDGRPPDRPNVLYLELPDEVKEKWEELSAFLNLRERDSSILSNLGTEFGRHMKLRHQMHKMLTVTVVAVESEHNAGGRCNCHLVFASAGTTIRDNNIRYRFVNPHAHGVLKRDRNDQIISKFHFYNGVNAGIIPTLVLVLHDHDSYNEWYSSSRR